MHIIRGPAHEGQQGAYALNWMGAMPVKQSPQTPCNCLAIRQAARVITQLYDRHLAAENLRTTQYSILSKLGRLGPPPVNSTAPDNGSGPAAGRFAALAQGAAGVRGRLWRVGRSIPARRARTDRGSDLT